MLDLTKSTNWRDYHPMTIANPSVSPLKQLADRTAQLDCAMEGYEERIAELEQTNEELRVRVNELSSKVKELALRIIDRG